MGKNSVGRYVLIFEPKYAYHQIAVRFHKNDLADIIKIKKYSDEVLENGNKTIKKNLLGDIDRITSSMTREEFFDKYIDPKLFNHRSSDVHRMFIGYKDAGRIKCLQVEFNNPKLYKKSKLIDGSKIKDRDCIDQIVKLLIDPESQFLRYVYEQQSSLRNQYFSSVSDKVLENAKNLRRRKKMMDNDGEDDLISDFVYLENQLKEKLTSYKEFRALYLFRNQYIYAKEEERKKLEETKQQLETISKKTKDSYYLYNLEELVPMGEQLSLYDSVDNSGEKVKKIK